MSKKYQHTKRYLWTKQNIIKTNPQEFFDKETDLLEEMGNNGWALVSVIKTIHEFPNYRDPLTDTVIEEPDALHFQYYFKKEKIYDDE